MEDNAPHVMKNRSHIEFAIFCVEAVAEKIGKKPEIVFDAFTKESRLLYEYIIPCYDVLHTQGKDYIVEDILSVMKEKGVDV